MVRAKESRSRYSKDHYSAPVVTISVDERQVADISQREYHRHREAHRHEYRRQVTTQDHSNSSNNDDDFNEYDYEIIDGRGNPPRIDFGGHHHHDEHPIQHHKNDKYHNADSYDDEEDEDDPRPLPDIRPTKANINLDRSGGSFRTALNNHPLVKQQQQQIASHNGTNGVYEKVRPPTMGMKPVHHQQSYQEGHEYDRQTQPRRQSLEEEGMKSHQQRYGRDYTPEGKHRQQQIRLNDVQPYLDEIDEIDVEAPPKPQQPKTIQISAGSIKNAPPPVNNNRRHWEPLQQKSQHQKEIEEIQQKIQQRRHLAAAKEMEDDRLFELEMARPSYSSKVRTVVDLLNKEPARGKDSLRSFMPPNEQGPYKASKPAPPTPAKASIPPPPPAPQNLLIRAGAVTPKQLQTDDVKSNPTDTLPPPPPQLQYRKPEPVIPSPSPPQSRRASKTGADYLSDEADLLLQYFKSNWQLVDYLNISIPNEVIDRMNRLPRKIVFLKDSTELAKLRKSRRPTAKRLRSRKAARGGLQKRVIERVASMKTEDICRIVSENSTLARPEVEAEREGEIYDAQVETKIYAKAGRAAPSSGRHSSGEHDEPVYEDSKWNFIKKGGRFVKKSAAALITKKQPLSPTPLQYPKAQGREMPQPPSEGLRTESRIAAEIQNLKEREDELRRNRAAMGLPNVHDLIGNWKHQDPRVCPLRETRSYNHLKINVNEQEPRNWPPLQSNGHYGMAKSESFHQLHHPSMHQYHPQGSSNHQQQPIHSTQSSITPKYLRRGTYDINASINSANCWTPVEKNYRRRMATLVSRRRIHSSRAPLPIYHPPQPQHIISQSITNNNQSVHHPSIIQPSIHTFNRNTPLTKSASRPLSRLLFASKRKPKPKSSSKRMGL